MKLNLITDRTPHDVERWKILKAKGWVAMTDAERQEWMGETTPTPSASKGMYTHKDLNRVENAVNELMGLLREYGYLCCELQVKTDWSYDDDFWSDDAKRYLSNIKTLRDCIRVKDDTPIAPNITDKFTYETANNIEKILADISDLLDSIPQSWSYAGEIVTGEV